MYTSTTTGFKFYRYNDYAGLQIFIHGKIWRTCKNIQHTGYIICSPQILPFYFPHYCIRKKMWIRTVVSQRNIQVYILHNPQQLQRTQCVHVHIYFHELVHVPDSVARRRNVWFTNVFLSRESSLKVGLVLLPPAPRIPNDERLYRKIGN